MAKTAEKISWSQLIAWVIKTCSTLWSAIRNAWTIIKAQFEVFAPLINEIQSLWTWTKGFAGQIYSDWIQPIADTVSWVGGKFADAVKWIDDTFNVIKAAIQDWTPDIVTSLSNVVTTIDDLGLKVARVVSYIDDDLASDISDATKAVYNNTLGKIDGVKQELTMAIDATQQVVKNYAKDLFEAFDDAMQPFREYASYANYIIKSSFDAPNQMNEETVRRSTEVYGDVYFAELIKKNATPNPEYAINQVNTYIPRTWLDDVRDKINAAAEGTYGDVWDILAKNIQAAREYSDVIGGAYKDDLLTWEEKQEIDAAFRKLTLFGLWTEPQIEEIKD